jgi:phosphatidylinositol 3-kinase
LNIKNSKAVKINDLSCLSLPIMETLQFGYSRDLPAETLKITVKMSLPGNFLVSACLVSEDELIDVSSVSPLKSGENAPLPFSTAKVRDLPLGAKLLLYIWRADEASVLVGFACHPIFNDSGVLLQDRRSLFLTEMSDFPEMVPDPVDAQFKDTFPLTVLHSVNAKFKRSTNDRDDLKDLLRADFKNYCCDSDKRFIVVTFPNYKCPIIFGDGGTKGSSVRKGRHTAPILTDLGAASLSVNWIVADHLVPTSEHVTISSKKRWYRPLVFVDFEAGKEHPAAVKAARLSRRSTVRLTAKPQQNPRPSPEELKRITEITSQPFRILTVEEKTLLLKYAWGIIDRKASLLKILQSVDWQDDGERANAFSLLTESAPIDIDDALILLGKDFSQCDPQIRAYAVKRLADSATKDDLRSYLLQLVQALHFESEDAVLLKFLVDRACLDERLASLLFWYIQCEEDSSGVFNKSAHYFWLELGKTEQGICIRQKIEIECAFRRRLFDIATDIKARKSERSERKTDRLRSLLCNPSESTTFDRGSSSVVSTCDLTQGSFSIPLPIDSRLNIIRIDSAMSFCAKSALSPLVLACEVELEHGVREIRRYMYKLGDDLRQDQLVIQLIQLIDSIFKRYGLDLKLTPYNVLATSKEDGFVEFVQDSHSLSSVLADHGDNLLDFFRTVRPSPNGFCGIDPQVLDTFARSCAGYCVITYVLGIGDRHLDNLLLTTDGRLFHVDFGYIMGRDPKPFPPPMKLCKEMVDGMGGANSVYYKNFVSKCCQAYSILRRHSKLLMSLLRLASDANIKDFKEQDAELALLKVQQKLQSDSSDAKAEQDFVALINESTSALFPVVMEKLHKWALYWR